MDWMDFNRDGEVDATEEYSGVEMLCSSREEHEALFGDAGLDRSELEFMDEDERREALEELYGRFSRMITYHMGMEIRRLLFHRHDRESFV